MRIDKCAQHFYLTRNFKLKLRQSTSVKLCKDKINSFSSIYGKSKLKSAILHIDLPSFINLLNRGFDQNVASNLIYLE